MRVHAKYILYFILRRESARVCDKYIYIFIEKVDRDHVWCRGGGAKETSAPEWDLHRYAGAESESWTFILLKLLLLCTSLSSMVPPEYRYGFHRVLSPPGAVVQAADVVDARPELLHPSECLLRVDRYSILNESRPMRVRVVSFRYCWRIWICNPQTAVPTLRVVRPARN